MSFKLIDNTYRASQAKELIETLVNDKISLLSKQNNQPASSIRIAELKETLSDVKQLLDLAETNNWQVHIDAEINITLKQ